MWGAWIEIAIDAEKKSNVKSHPVWGAWIEMWNCPASIPGVTSHPVWGAWIEITDYLLPTLKAKVAPRVGCVD